MIVGAWNSQQRQRVLPEYFKKVRTLVVLQLVPSHCSGNILSGNSQKIFQGGHKPGILRDFSEHGKLGEFSGNSVLPLGKIVTNKVFLVHHSNVCIKQLLTG